MTLCVAWKWATPHGAQIYFAADTCVTFGANEMEFGGVKIAEIPVIYRGPLDQATGHQDVFEYRYGFAFSGEYLAAFLVRELTGQILIHLQGIGGPATASFDNLCELVGKVHQRLHAQIKSNLRFGERVEFFFAGFCPVSQAVRVAKFYVDSATGNVARIEILTRAHGESYDTLGSDAAQVRFRELLQTNLEAPPCRVHFAMFRRLRDVILDQDIPSVGGAIQCGEFAAGSRDFRLLGAGMVEKGDHNLQIKTYLGGTDVEKLHQPDPCGLHIHHSVAVPFHEDIATFAPDKSYWAPDGRRVLLDELITVLPHNPRWLSKFAEAKKTLRSVIGRRIAIEHIGSTAVPGLPAVPTIDIMIGLAPLDESDLTAKELAKLGYEYLGTSAAEVRPLLRKRDGENVNLYFAEPTTAFWVDGLALRSLLQRDEKARKVYSTRKLEILNTQAGTLYRYNELKMPSLEAIRSEAVLTPRMPQKRWWHAWLS